MARVSRVAWRSGLSNRYGLGGFHHHKGGSFFQLLAGPAAFVAGRGDGGDGLPVPTTDLDDVAGVRISFGSPLFADHGAEQSCLMVEALEAEGALVYAKSNSPEFGAERQYV